MLRRICRLLGAKADDFVEANQLPILAQGDTVPADGVAGYGVGCLFFHRDGGNGNALYVNEGTEASCDFNAISVA